MYHSPTMGWIAGISSSIHVYTTWQHKFSRASLFNRLALAALHFNENSSREQATTSSGEERFNILFPKCKEDISWERSQLTQHTVCHNSRQCLLTPMYACVCPHCRVRWEAYEGINETMQKWNYWRITFWWRTGAIKCPGQYEHPEKASATKSHKSRFSL